MTTLFAEVTATDTEDTQQAVPVTCSTLVTPGFTTFRGIQIGKSHYRDITARCRCSDVRLMRYGFAAYAKCEAHDMTALGPLVREQTTGGRLA